MISPMMRRGYHAAERGATEIVDRKQRYYAREAKLKIPIPLWFSIPFVIFAWENVCINA